jgi:hypothetical protein
MAQQSIRRSTQKSKPMDNSRTGSARKHVKTGETSVAIEQFMAENELVASAVQSLVLGSAELWMPPAFP